MQVWGGVGCSTSLLLLTVGDAQRSIPLILFGMCTFLFAFSASYGKPPLDPAPCTTRTLTGIFLQVKALKEQCRHMRLQISMPKAYLQVVDFFPCAELSFMHTAYHDCIYIWLGVWQSSQVREWVVSLGFWCSCCLLGAVCGAVLHGGQGTCIFCSHGCPLRVRRSCKLLVSVAAHLAAFSSIPGLCGHSRSALSDTLSVKPHSVCTIIFRMLDVEFL